MRRLMIVCLIAVLIGAVAFCGCRKRIHEERTTTYNQDGTKTEEMVRTRNEKVVLKWTKEWDIRILRAEGRAVVPTTAETPGQGELLAEAGAIADAEAKLLHQLENVYVTEEKRMIDFMTSVKVRTSVQGCLKGAKVVAREFDKDSGIYSVTMELPLNYVRTRVKDYIQ